MASQHSCQPVYSTTAQLPRPWHAMHAACRPPHLTCCALDGKLAPYEVGELPVGLHAPRQRAHTLTQRAVALQGQVQSTREVIVNTKRITRINAQLHHHRVHIQTSYT
eukprot:GHRQ01036813.1.p1 GENE.GHRQ01036813.1~~GHRQ01036813.1.p1  ORF type:complete len:108 (+),score=11.18 GHRQ01036813.1:288-611(+)